MSGVETVAGLALEVLPIMKSAVEQYDDCSRPFTRFKNFGKEADRFCKHFCNQKTIFRSQCLIVLKELVEDDIASSTLDGVNYKSLTECEVDEHLTRLLGDNREACVTTIRMIEDQLGEIEDESQDLRNIIDQDRQVLSLSSESIIRLANLSDEV